MSRTVMLARAAIVAPAMILAGCGQSIGSTATSTPPVRAPRHRLA
jgi:hypothetical protein